jgi:hypothetical protein
MRSPEFGSAAAGFAVVSGEKGFAGERTSGSTSIKTEVELATPKSA